MSNQKKINLLINLPSGFFTHPDLKQNMDHLSGIYNVRQKSHNTQEEILPDLKWAEAIIMWGWPTINDAMLDQAPQLRFIGHINGYQSVCKYTLKRGITISEARHCWSPAVSELALGLILCGLRKISDYHAGFRSGNEKWVGDFPMDIDPLERQLTGRSVGIVGFGRIGQRLTEFLKPFQADVKTYDPYLPAEVAKQYNVTQLDLAEVLSQSEIVVLCAASNKTSDNLLGAKEIEMLRPNSLLVNVGRSSLIDMAALEKRLEKGDLIAMLDVFDREPLEKDSKLRCLPNAYLTAHRGGGIIESLQRALSMLTEDLEAFLDNRKLKYPLTEAMIFTLPE